MGDTIVLPGLVYIYNKHLFTTTKTLTVRFTKLLTDGLQSPASHWILHPFPPRSGIYHDAYRNHAGINKVLVVY